MNQYAAQPNGGYAFQPKSVPSSQLTSQHNSPMNAKRSMQAQMILPSQKQLLVQQQNSGPVVQGSTQGTTGPPPKQYILNGNAKSMQTSPNKQK